MSKQDTTTNEQQMEQSQGQAAARQPQETRVSRGSRDLVGLPFTPMDLLRMNPISLMRRMSDEMDRVMADMVSGRRTGGTSVWAPAIEVSKRDGDCVVRAELPGLKPEEVRLEVTEDTIVIEGERKVEREEDRDGVQLTERQYGHFYRAIPLPDGADIQNARAVFDNGVLEITVPVENQRSSRRQIKIETKSSDSKRTGEKAA